MFKKTLLAFLMLCSVETKPFFMEIFALVGLVVTARTKPARFALRYAWTNFKGYQNRAPFGFQRSQELPKFDHGSRLMLGVYAMRAKAAVAQSRANLTSVLTNLKNRIKNPAVLSIESSQTVTCSSTTSSWTPYTQKVARSSSGTAANQPPYSMTQINAQQNNLQQNNYGFIHWYARQTGKSDEWVREFGNKRFWQGFAAGGAVGTFGMAWLMKSSNSEENRKKSTN